MRPRSEGEVHLKVEWSYNALLCGLTPAHDQRGAARCGELTRARAVVPARNQGSAAPRLVHALVRPLPVLSWEPPHLSHCVGHNYGVGIEPELEKEPIAPQVGAAEVTHAPVQHPRS